MKGARITRPRLEWIILLKNNFKVFISKRPASFLKNREKKNLHFAGLSAIIPHRSLADFSAKNARFCTCSLTEFMLTNLLICRSGFQLPSMKTPALKSSLKFLLPSLLYAVNNNIYYAGLMLVPPPIWLILCSFRTVVTASMYKVIYTLLFYL